MTYSKKQLLELQEEIQDAKSSVSELKGQQTAILRQLKDDFACPTLEKAEEKLEFLNKRKETLDKKIKKESDELEVKLNQEEEEENDNN